MNYVCHYFFVTKLWEGILEKTASKDFAMLPINLKSEWMGILNCILDSRVASITSSETKVQLFCHLEMQKNPNEFLTNVFMVHAAEALDDTFSSTVGNIEAFN